VADEQSGRIPTLVPAPTDRGGHNVRGIVAMVAACALFACGDTFMKLLANSVPTSELIFIRGIFVLMGAFIGCVYLGAFAHVHRALSRAMAVRALGETTGAWSFQLALTRMPYADLSAIGQLSPLTITAASAIFYAERVGWRRWTATAVGLMGVLLIIRPGSNTFEWWALAGLVSVLGSTVRDLATRRIEPTVPPPLIMLFSASLTTATGLVSSLVGDWTWPPAYVVFWLMAAASFSLVGQVCTIYAVRTGEISAVIPFRYSIILFAIVSGVAVFGDFPDVLTLTGIVIVCGAGLYTFFREQKLRRLAAAARAASAAADETASTGRAP
jgi:drug/metabolite transporter (DMT)-like permease